MAKTNLEQALDSIKRIGSFSEGEKIALVKGLRLSLFPGNWSVDSVSDDDILQYNSTTGLWENTALTGGTFVSLTDTPASYTGEALKFAMVNAGETAVEFSDVLLDVDDLSDVTAPSPSTDDVLSWSGAAWVNRPETVLSVNAYVGDVVLDATDVTPTSLKGDLLVDDGTEVTFIGIGTNGQVLEADSTEATGMKWATPASGFADPMTTRGDLIYKNAGGTTVRLGAGTVGQVLTSDGTDIAWGASSSTPEGTAILSTGEVGGTKFLREDGDGTCSWQDVAAGGATDFTDLGDVPSTYVGQANRWVRVNAGATALEFVSASPVTQVTGTAPVVSSGGTTPAISMPAAASGVSGYMSSTLWTKLDGIENNADVTDSTNVAAAGAWIGNITVSTSSPSGGDNGDIWFEIS